MCHPLASHALSNSRTALSAVALSGLPASRTSRACRSAHAAAFFALFGPPVEDQHGDDDAGNRADRLGIHNGGKADPILCEDHEPDEHQHRNVGKATQNVGTTCAIVT